jgi:hypothetical protein
LLSDCKSFDYPFCRRSTPHVATIDGGLSPFVNNNPRCEDQVLLQITIVHHFSMLQKRGQRWSRDGFTSRFYRVVQQIRRRWRGFRPS